MALHIPRPPGFTSMLKDGAKHYSGLDEAVYRNISACKELAQTTRSAFGPNGQNKMVINHLEKLFVTNDAATILQQLEVEHPAAKMLVMASQQQEQECGDGTNFVLIFAGALLEKAEEVIRMGLSVTEVIEGYELACRQALELLGGLVVDEVKDLHDQADVARAVRCAVMSKQYGLEDFLAEKITQACISVVPPGKEYFNVDNIRVSKIPGQGVLSTTVMKGMVFRRTVESDVTKAEDCKVVVYSCPLDIMQTETKGVVKINTAKELMEFSKGEESQVEAQIRAISEAGAKVVVTGGKVGELAMHFANKYKLLVVRLMSKFDLRRLARSTGATALPRVTKPTAEEMGHCRYVCIDEVGDSPVIIFRQEDQESSISTVCIRGATENIMDDVERAVDDGVNTFKALTKDKRLVAGGGATEIELARNLATYGEKCPGLEQFAIKCFSEALEVVPRALAENAGVKAAEAVAALYASHEQGAATTGFGLEGTGPQDMRKARVFDLYATKYWGLRFATQAACTVLRVDQIIMAKKAGGPKPPKDNKNWDED